MLEICNAQMKQGVLHAISAIYDPLGHVSPVVLPGKLLLQRMWKDHLQWDEPLPTEYIERWKAIVGCIQHIATLVIPRYIGKPLAVTPVISCFVWWCVIVGICHSHLSSSLYTSDNYCTADFFPSQG